MDYPLHNIKIVRESHRSFKQYFQCSFIYVVLAMNPLHNGRKPAILILYITLSIHLYLLMRAAQEKTYMLSSCVFS